MSDQNYQPPRVRNILLGIIAFMVLLLLLCNLSSTMKHVGNVFLYLPSQLGLIQRVKPGEVHIIDLRTPSPALLDFTKPGRYAVFTSDYDLLMTNVLSGSAWLQVKSQATGEAVEVAAVSRGARPYDTYLAAGRPIFVFNVPVPGSYEFAYYFRLASITIVPDYTTGKESVIVLAYIVQIAILLTLFVIIDNLSHQRHRDLVRSIKDARANRRSGIR